MSLTLHSAIEQADHGNQIRPMALPRLNAGLTSRAHLHVGDTLNFGGMDMVISSVRHKYASDLLIAPQSIVYASPVNPLHDDEISELQQIGFVDL